MKRLSEKIRNLFVSKFRLLCEMQEAQIDSKIYATLDRDFILIEMYPN